MTPHAVGFVTRAEAGLRAPKSVSRNITPQHGGLAVHWGGGGSAPVAHGDCLKRWKAWQDFHMTSRGWTDIAYCVDEETEALTQRGWVTHDDLHAGDVVLTLNHNTGLAEWQPVEGVHRFDGNPQRKMLRIDQRNHSSLTTLNHRWPVERYVRTSGKERERDEHGRFVESTYEQDVHGRHERVWATSESLTYWDRIVRSAPVVNLPSEAKYTDALVALVAWFYTEGNVPRLRDGSLSRSAVIYQSRRANPSNCDRIRGALTSLFGPAQDGLRGLDAPAWREARYTGDKVEFHLNALAAEIVRDHAPGFDKIVRPEFIVALTEAQLRLFVEVSLAADGSKTEHGGIFSQKVSKRADTLQMAASLLGLTATKQERLGTGGVTMVSVSASPRGRTAGLTGGRGEVVSHDGLVWCPQTKNQSWFARRRGMTYFTGNSFGYCNHGYVFAGRGLGVRSGAQGTTVGNQNFYAACWIGGSQSTPTTGALEALLWLIQAARNADAGLAVRPHSWFKSTACPGNNLRGFILPYHNTELEDNMSVSDWAKNSWDWARGLGIFSESTRPKDNVTAEQLGVLLSRYNNHIGRRIAKSGSGVSADEVIAEIKRRL